VTESTVGYSAERREFLGSIGGLLAAAPFGAAPAHQSDAGAALIAGPIKAMAPEIAARDESLWVAVQHAFDVDREYLNLGCVLRGTCPRGVMEAIVEYLARSNKYLLDGSGDGFLTRRREFARARVAGWLGCAPEEIALTRNTTDGITTVISGFPFRPGDEVLTTTQEHPPFYGTLHRHSIRHQLTIRSIDIPTPAGDPDEISRAFEGAITTKTRLILVSHLSLAGQILPIADIATIAHARGAQVLVDGALALGQIEVNVKELGCDYYCASFHKFGCGPRATGLFYCRPEHAAELHPVYGTFDEVRFRPDWDSPDVRKFERFGTHSNFLVAAIPDMVDFHEAIGASHVRARLHHLKSLWVTALRTEPSVRFCAAPDAAMSASLMTFSVNGFPARQLMQVLRDRHRVLVGGTTLDAVVGSTRNREDRDYVLVSPALFTTEREIGMFVGKLRLAIREGPAR